MFLIGAFMLTVSTYFLTGTVYGASAVIGSTLMFVGFTEAVFNFLDKQDGSSSRLDE